MQDSCRLVTCDVVACIHNWSYPDLRANNYDSGRGRREVVTCVACGIVRGGRSQEYISAVLGPTATSLESSGCWEQTHKHTPSSSPTIPDHNNKQKLSYPFRLIKKKQQNFSLEISKERRNFRRYKFEIQKLTTKKTRQRRHKIISKSTVSSILLVECWSKVSQHIHLGSLTECNYSHIRMGMHVLNYNM